VIDDALGDEVRVTVIAAGFDGGAPKRREQNTPVVRREREDRVPAQVAVPVERERERDRERPSERTGERIPALRPERVPAPARVERAEPKRTLVFEDTDDDLDVPDFLK
ncbi:MAG: cell division protein FtsZ, partial [Mycobacteriales bacterium]